MTRPPVLGPHVISTILKILLDQVLGARVGMRIKAVSAGVRRSSPDQATFDAGAARTAYWPRGGNGHAPSTMIKSALSLVTVVSHV